jgi:hypothetical protein
MSELEKITAACKAGQLNMKEALQRAYKAGQQSTMTYESVVTPSGLMDWNALIQADPQRAIDIVLKMKSDIIQ